MSQTRLLDYKADLTSANENTKWKKLLYRCVASGMAVQKGTGDFDITIGSGWWFCDGVVITESSSLVDELTLDSPDVTHPRIDVIYGTFEYEADTSPTPASYGILKGTPAASPTKPTTSESQVELAEIYVPTSASDLDGCYIKPAWDFLTQLENLLGKQWECNFWIRSAGDPFLTSGNPTISKIKELGIKDGDPWIDLTGLDLYIYDADSNTWVSSDVNSHASTHSCGSSDPIDVKDLCDTLSYLHSGTKAYHESLGLSHDSLSDVSENDHHNKDHGSRHHEGGGDPLDVKDLVDSLAFLHNTHPGLCPTPHGDAHHNQAYATKPHAHDEHTGTIAAGWIGFDTSPNADCPTGTHVWHGRITGIDITDTAVKLTKLLVYAETAPSEQITFEVFVNDVSKGTINLSGTSGSNDIADVTLAEGDEVRLDAPADANGTKGLIFRGNIVRVAT